MTKLALASALLLGSVALPACGSGGESASQAAPDQPPAGSRPGVVTPEQRAETRAAVTCLSRFARRLEGGRQFGRPAVAGTLRSGNPIVMVMYGPAGGAREGEAQILREHPRYATYHAPNDKILVFLGHKVAVSSPDFTAADACQRLAGAAG